MEINGFPDSNTVESTYQMWPGSGPTLGAVNCVITNIL